MSGRVSVVIAAYNAAALIAETLESVLAQTYSDVEIVVVDDGSTDQTAAVVGSFPGVRCVRKANGGLGSARNAGIAAATGDYIAIVDSDDLWYPDKLETQIAELERTGAAWCYCDAEIMDGPSGRILGLYSHTHPMPSGHVLEDLFADCFIASPTPVVRRHVFDVVGVFDVTPVVHMREDWDMWLRIAARFPLAAVGRPLAKYRVHPSANSSTENGLAMLRSLLYVIDRAVAREPRLAERRAATVGRLHLEVGQKFARQGEFRGARSQFRLALQAQPRSMEAAAYWTSTFLGATLFKGALSVRDAVRRRGGHD